MKHVLCFVTFAIGALCLAAFVATVRPLSAALATSKPANCIMASSGTPGCDTEWRWSHFKGRSSSRSISELPSVVSTGPIVERNHAT
jgi:hypothetical protein